MQASIPGTCVRLLNLSCEPLLCPEGTYSAEKKPDLLPTHTLCRGHWCEGLFLRDLVQEHEPFLVQAWREGFTEEGRA